MKFDLQQLCFVYYILLMFSTVLCFHYYLGTLTANDMKLKRVYLFQLNCAVDIADVVSITSVLGPTASTAANIFLAMVTCHSVMPHVVSSSRPGSFHIDVFNKYILFFCVALMTSNTTNLFCG